MDEPLAPHAVLDPSDCVSHPFTENYNPGYVIQDEEDNDEFNA